jgi:L-fuconate dehydratase
VVIRKGRYVTPTLPGYSIEMKKTSLEEYDFDTGPVWNTNQK